MRTAFWIFAGTTAGFILAAYTSYRVLMFFIDSGEGGDTIGPRGVIAFIAMFLLIILSLVSGMFTLGIWFGERNRRKRDDKVLGL